MSAALAGVVAHLAFWLLLAYGWLSEELGPRSTALALAAWLAGFFGLPRLPYGAALFPSFVALLDIVLVFVIFKGDVRLT